MPGSPIELPYQVWSGQPQELCFLTEENRADTRGSPGGQGQVLARGRCWPGSGVGQRQALARSRCWPGTGVGQGQVVAKSRWWSGAGIG